MNGQSLREAAMQAPRKTQDVSTPFWPGTDGQIQIADTPIDDLTLLSPLAKTDSASYSAALIIKTLISKETQEPVFSDADRDWLKASGSVVMALITPINEFFGFDTKKAIDAAKNA
jgi:hypothetical protein